MKNENTKSVRNESANVNVIGYDKRSLRSAKSIVHNKTTFSNSERETLKNILIETGYDWNITEPTEMLDGLHARIVIGQRNASKFRTELIDRQLHGFYTTRTAPQASFYYATLFTGGRTKPKFQRQYHSIEYDKHFVSGKTFGEFTENLKQALAAKFE